MILTIDIGNTNVTLGGFCGDELMFVARTSTDTSATEDDYAYRILNMLSLHSVDRSKIKGAIAASVVPQLNVVIRRAVNLVLGVEPMMVEPGIKTGISIRCDTPSSVGADLISASVAAHFIYGGSALIVDVGTATKMTVVDKNGAFTGTSIIPGIMMGLFALSNETAQLPKISLESPGSIIAKNTVDCMKSGVVYGNACMIDGMIDRIKEEVGEDLSVYITGGNAALVLPYCKQKMIFDEHLVLKGLNIIYKRNS